MWESWNAIDENGNRDGCSFNTTPSASCGGLDVSISSESVLRLRDRKITIAPDTGWIQLHTGERLL